MIEALISSKTRIKLLLKFFLNGSTKAYLRSLESEFGESSNAIRVELNRLEKAGMLVSHMDGNKKIFQANRAHPLFGELHNILLKHIGIDKIIENVIARLGDVEKVYLTGDFARGRDSNVIDLVLVGDIDKAYLIRLIDKVEELIHRKIRYLVYHPGEYAELDREQLDPEPLLLWSDAK